MNKLKMFLGMLICISFLFANAAFAADVAINSTNFPDDNFREYVKQFDSDGNNVLSDAERNAIEDMYVGNMGISKLKGIEHFTAVKYLDCSNNKLTSLNVTKNTALEELRANNNQLTSLNVTKNTALRHIECMNNQLTKLDVTKNTELVHLDLGNNQLASLNVTKNTKLDALHIWDNKLKKIDVTKNTKLTWLNVGGNQLTTLNVTKNTELQRLYCYGNNFKSLNVTKNAALIDFQCNGSSITSINVKSNPNLEILICDGNQLKSLNLTNNYALRELNCRGNQITSLNLNNNGELRDLNCSYNQLTKLDVSNNWWLQELNCSANKITTLNLGDYRSFKYLYCYENQLKTLDVSNTSWHLNTIECYSNKLTSLKLGDAGSLRTLDCEDNNLSKIDISGCGQLRRIFADDDVSFIEEVIDGTLNNSGTVGEEYSSTIYVKGGQWPYTWKKQSGTLPKGLKLTFDENYVTLSGTPTQANEYNFYLQVTDRRGLSVKKKFTIKISEATTTVSKSSKSTTKDKEADTKKSTEQKGSAPTTETLNTSPKKDIEKDKSPLNFSVENFSAINSQAGEIVEGNTSNKTSLEVIGENKLWQGVDRDEDLIEVEANKPVSFKIGKWINSDGSEVKTKIPLKDIEILIDEKVFEGIKISDDGEFIVPAEIVVSDFKIQARAKLSKDLELETVELFISVMQ